MGFKIEKIAGRNDPCPCESGKKYKRCCARNTWEDFGTSREKLASNSVQRMEPYLNVVPSLIFKGKRVRAIWSKLYFRPPEETYHEFLLLILGWTFGETWRQGESRKFLPHIVYKWNESYKKFRKENSTIPANSDGPNWGALPTGKVQALLALAFDLFVLQIVNKLPGFMVRRLRDRHKFQSVRYEIEIAAIMTRAGFEIEYLDDKIKSEKHCEFIATHKASGIKVGVEAKSRRRPGVLHELGLFDPAKDIKGDVRSLFQKAKKQKPQGLPFLIFLDLNLPPSKQAAFLEKPWGAGIKQMLDKEGHSTKEKPDPYNALILTNHSYHFFEDQRAKGGEYGVVMPMFTEVSLPAEILNDVLASVQRYGRIPSEA